MQSSTGANVWNTTLLIGWDEPGGTYDHVPPPAVPSPDAASSPGELGFGFDRSGYRVPAIIVSPWVAEGEVFNEEYRHTSLIATLREQWGLGDPFTARDAAARTFSNVFTLDTPRDPNTLACAEAAAGAEVHPGHRRARRSALRRRQDTCSTGSEGTPPNTTSRSTDSRRTPRPTYPPNRSLALYARFLGSFFPLLASEGSPSSK